MEKLITRSNVIVFFHKSHKPLEKPSVETMKEQGYPILLLAYQDFQYNFCFHNKENVRIVLINKISNLLHKTFPTCSSHISAYNLSFKLLGCKKLSLLYS